MRLFNDVSDVLPLRLMLRACLRPLLPLEYVLELGTALVPVNLTGDAILGLIALRLGQVISESDPLGGRSRLMFVFCVMPCSRDLNVGKRSRFAQF